MSLPTSYLTSFKNLPKILMSIQNAQAPKKFTTTFLESLGYKSAPDRLIIGVLKAIGFLNAEGAPTNKYYEFLDQTQGKRILAEGVREAYADLFQINRKAQELSAAEVRNKLKTLTQGQYGDSVLEKMAGTFKALAQQADFSMADNPSVSSEPIEPPSVVPELVPLAPSSTRAVQLGGLVYNIQLVLPADRDRAVYDALFRSLREHLVV